MQYREEKGYVKEYDEKGVETSFLFANRTGKLPHLETFSKRFKQIIDELNDEGLLDIQPSFHSLRGSGISYYVMNQQVSLPIVQKFAGHSDIKTTMKYYVKVEDKDVIELSKRSIDIF